VFDDDDQVAPVEPFARAVPQPEAEWDEIGLEGLTVFVENLYEP
jgi:hypothetical protein